MAQYSFVTYWNFNAPVERVWKEIRSMDTWTEWWKYVKSVELIQPGDENDIHSVRRITWTTALPYKLTFDSELIYLDPLKCIEGNVYGELTGTGIWTFTNNGHGTTVRYDWVVSTSKWWMKIVEPLARPVFKWNHDRVMHAGYKGLAKRLLN